VLARSQESIPGGSEQLAQPSATTLALPGGQPARLGRGGGLGPLGSQAGGLLQLTYAAAGLAKRYRLDRTISYLQIEQRGVTHRDLRFIKDDEVIPRKKSTVVVHAGFSLFHRS